MMRWARPALWLAFVISACPSAAHAFCRTSTCKNCSRDSETGCTVGGTPLVWPAACLSFSMAMEASAQVDLDTATSLMAEAFATWEAADCDGAGSHPSIHVSDAFGPVECTAVGYSAHAGNANAIIFRDDTWPYSGQGNDLAVTSVTFDSNGVIYDADMEINATSPLIVNASPELLGGLIVNQHDLRSIMIHEAGHFLGLDHSRVADSIMTVSLSAGEVRTTLADDDRAAICELYPPERETAECDPTPHGGFSATCPASNKGCSVALPRSAPSAPAWLLVWGLLTLCIARRRQLRRERFDSAAVEQDNQRVARR